MFAAPALTGLRKLNLLKESFSSAAIEALVGLCKRCELEELRFSRCSFEAGCLDVLGAAKHLCDGLHVVKCEVDDDTAIALARSPLVQTLRRFSLEEDGISEAVAQALLEVEPPELTHVIGDPRHLGEGAIWGFLDRGWLWGRMLERFERRIRFL